MISWYIPIKYYSYHRNHSSTFRLVNIAHRYPILYPISHSISYIPMISQLLPTFPILLKSIWNTIKYPYQIFLDYEIHWNTNILFIIYSYHSSTFPTFHHIVGYCWLPINHIKSHDISWYIPIKYVSYHSSTAPLFALSI